MDTSETYFKMRLQAIPDLGVGVAPLEPLVRSSFRYISIDSKGDWYYDFFSLCQIERQDQLQEMLAGSAYSKLQNIFKALRDFELTPYHHSEKAFPFESIEQLWLAFVMKEKYNKIWNGKDWILNDTV